MNRQSYMEISKSNFRYNIEQIEKYVKGKKIMPIIKANGYGTHVNRCLELIEDFDIVGVACVSEAIDLRNLGYKGEIFVLNQPYMEDIENIIKYNVTVGVSDINFIRGLARTNKLVKVHIELETGMNRTGVQDKYLESFIDDIVKYPTVYVEGVYTHFSSADVDYEYTNRQIDIFNSGVELIKRKIDTINYVHCSASNGLLNFDVDTCNMVRAGIIMYGYPSSDTTLDKIDIKPIAKLKSKINYIKVIEKDESVSYGRRFTSNDRMTVATVGIGYADGVRRSLSNKGYVVIRDIKCPIIGSVCMDSFLVDVSKVKNVDVGDDVYIWDNEKITLEDIASIYDTINYEVLSGIGERVPRVFID